MLNKLPSKFFKSVKERTALFEIEVLKLARKHGYEEVMICYAEPYDETQTYWHFRMKSKQEKALISFIEDTVIPTIESSLE